MVIDTSAVVAVLSDEPGAPQIERALAEDSVRLVSAAEHVEIAREAFGRLGKGRHSAGLNFGDCFAYALAIQRGEPLLIKGEGFAKTDITAVSCS